MDYTTSFSSTHFVILIFPFADLQSTIGFLKTQSGNRDQQLRILKEKTSNLDKRVDQLSKRINGLQTPTYPVYRNAGALILNEIPPKPNEEPKSITLEQATIIDVLDTAESEPPKKLGLRFFANSAEVRRERKSHQHPPRQPLTRNEIGLKCRSVCTDDDNRVKCLEGRDRELFKTPLKRPSLETDDELNLPTRDEWTKLRRTRKMDGTKPKSKRWFFNQQIFFIGIKNKIYKNINAITHILINLIYLFDLNIFY